MAGAFQADAFQGFQADSAALGGGGLSWQDANASWNARNRWAKEAAKWLAETSDNESPEAAEAATESESTQEAPQRPRMAEPAPLQPAMRSSALDALLLRAGELPIATRLQQAMFDRQRKEIARAAMLVERALAEEEEAVAMLLLLMEAA